MKFFCVTPCLNTDKYIEGTMLSVINQTVFQRKDCSLCYVIMDGGSTDSTLEKIKSLTKTFNRQDNINIVSYSEKDSGMYDALAKGFKEDTNSDVYSYINAGDYYSRYAFEIVLEIFSQNEVYFLTGFNAVYNSKNHIVNCTLPFEYNRSLLRKGFYGTVLPFVQQESTFWHRSVHQNIDLNELVKFKYAGDYYLWSSLIKSTPLYIVSAWLGGFKKHEKQLSSIFTDEYKKEVTRISARPNIFDYILAYYYKFMGYLPNGIKKRLSNHMFAYDHTRQKYCLTKQ